MLLLTKTNFPHPIEHNIHDYNNYNKNKNVSCILCDRKIIPDNKNINVKDFLKNNYKFTYNATDGFLFINIFLKILNIKNINLLGFSTFGSNENTINKNYIHNTGGSENQIIEADILLKLVENNIIKTLENIDYIKKY
jgi:hypothetical protein